MDPYSGERFDVIVVGGGIMGSCAAYEAAKRGQRVLLLERFDFLHHRGSSHGESRTIRATYPESYYLSMVLDSSRLWEEAQSEMGYRVITRTTQFDMGPADDRSLNSVIANCADQSNSMDLQILHQTQVATNFSDTFKLPDGWIGVSTSLGGIIKPTKALAMYHTLAIRRGAVLRDHMEVEKIETDSGGVRVSTATGEHFSGKKCVVSVGAWTKRLVKEMCGRVLPIQPLHTTICYWKIKDGYEFQLSPDGGFPTFASYGETYVYGTPSMEFPGLMKIALHGGQPCDPDKREWAASSGRGPMVESVARWIERVLPGCIEAGKPVMAQACMYSMTPDEDFVIDFLGGEFGEDVVVAGGFSGHGFKMGPVVGRILVEMAIDGVAKGVEMRHFRIRRFEDNPRGNVKEYEDQVTSHFDP